MFEHHAPRTRQQGYATLFVGVVLLAVMSLMTVYLNKSGILDLRTSADKARYAQALAEAERRIEVGMAWINNRNSKLLDPSDDDKWSPCEGAAPTATLDDARWDDAFDNDDDWVCLDSDELPTVTSTDPFYVAARLSTTSNAWVYFLVAEGSSDDGEAHAVVKQGVHFPLENWVASAPPPPIMGSGTVDLSGTFSVVANPDGAGPGVPVSIWSASGVQEEPGVSSWATCQLYEYQATGDCSVEPMSQKDALAADVIPNDPDYPEDMFEYLFGIESADYALIKDHPSVIKLNNCTTLPAIAAANYGNDAEGNPIRPIVWVTGDCDIGTNTVGDDSHPIVLVVQPSAALPGDFTMRAGSVFNGLLFAFDEDGNAGDVKALGHATFNGSMLSNDVTEFGLNTTGTFNMIYKSTILKQSLLAIHGVVPSILAKVPGSWADYLQ